MKIELSDKEFLELKDIIYKASGIYAKDEQRENLEHKLSSRLNEQDIGSFREYHKFLLKNRAEIQAVVDAVTTNETYFFREKKHFNFLKDNILPNVKYDTFRCWSAAGSIGAEAYSIAMLIQSNLSSYKNFQVVASDINKDVLSRAKKGVYPIKFAKKIPLAFLQSYCKKGKNEHKGFFKIDSKLQKSMDFKLINLMKPINKELGEFDLIFLRNMIIYFEDKDKKIIVENVIKQLKDGGYLFMGHSESLNRITDKVVQISPSIYQKIQKKEIPSYKPKKYLAKTSQKIIAIGSSMGGLSVIKDMIDKLLPNIPPVLIVQHMSRDILTTLLPKLSENARVNLKIAKDEELLEIGTIYFAPFKRHLKIKNISKGIYKVVLSDEDKVANHKPSIDVLFNSFALEVKSHSSAFLLSGMGNDGVTGISNIKKAHGKTYAQDEESSDVFGMSRVAINKGVIDNILSADKLADSINKI